MSLAGLAGWLACNGGEAGDGVLLERQVVVAVHVRQLPDAVGICEIKFVEKSQGNSKQGVSSGRGPGLG